MTTNITGTVEHDDDVEFDERDVGELGGTGEPGEDGEDGDGEGGEAVDLRAPAPVRNGTKPAAKAKATSKAKAKPKAKPATAKAKPKVKAKKETVKGTPPKALALYTPASGPIKSGVPGGTVVSTTGLTLPDNLSQNAWMIAVEYVGKLSVASPWLVGDALIYGEENFKVNYAETLSLLGIDKPTLKNYVYVCRTFGKNERREDLTFTHHLEVASLYRENPLLGAELLKEAAANAYPVLQLRRLVKAYRDAAARRATVLTEEGEDGESVTILTKGPVPGAPGSASGMVNGRVNWMALLQDLAKDVDVLRNVLEQEPLDEATYDEELAAVVEMARTNEYIDARVLLRSLAIMEQRVALAERETEGVRDRLADVQAEVKRLQAALASTQAPTAPAPATTSKTQPVPKPSQKGKGKAS